VDLLLPVHKSQSFFSLQQYMDLRLKYVVP
jgi:hypothetical protein